MLVHSAAADEVVTGKVKAMRDAWVEDPDFRDKVRLVVTVGTHGDMFVF